MGPAIRANVTKGSLDFVLRTGSPSVIAAVRERLPAAAHERVASARDVDWIALDDHLAVLDVLRSVLGDEAYRAAAKDGTLRVLDDSLLGPIVRVALRVLDATPSSLVAWMRRSWHTVFRDCGTLEQEDLNEHASRIELRGYPGGARSVSTFALGLAGTFDALIELAGARGTVRFDVGGGANPRVESIVYQLDWRA